MPPGQAKQAELARAAEAKAAAAAAAKQQAAAASSVKRELSADEREEQRRRLVEAKQVGAGARGLSLGAVLAPLRS